MVKKTTRNDTNQGSSKWLAMVQCLANVSQGHMPQLKGYGMAAENRCRSSQPRAI
jgi:hypothetical protein